MKCQTCKYKETIPGDCHVSCANPPTKILGIGSGGNERYAVAEKMAKENCAVVRCVWPGCGMFPFCFDDNTIFGCVNYKEKV